MEDKMNTSCPVKGCTGTLIERRVFDDWDGTVTCSVCWYSVDRYEEE